MNNSVDSIITLRDSKHILISGEKHLGIYNSDSHEFSFIQIKKENNRTIKYRNLFLRIDDSIFISCKLDCWSGIHIWNY